MSDGPMIEVENLTKRFAGHSAVSQISFTVGRGEIVGLLGHAGRILASDTPENLQRLMS